MSRGPSRSASKEDVTAGNPGGALGGEPSQSRFLSRADAPVVVAGGDDNDLRAPLTGNTPAPQGPNASVKMFGCLMQAGAFIATPFKAAASAVYENPKKALATAFMAGLTVSFDLCARGLGHFAGKPEGYCNNALNTLTQRDAVIATVGGSALLATMFVVREVEHRRQLAAVEAGVTAVAPQAIV